jgi:hypothetical protein
LGPTWPKIKPTHADVLPANLGKVQVWDVEVKSKTASGDRQG